MIALVFAPSAEMIGWCMGVGVKLEGGRGSGSLVWWPSLKPRASAFYPELSGCAGETPSGAGLSRKVGRVSGGCRSTLQVGGALSLFIQSPTLRLFFSVFVLAGKIGNYTVVNATLNRKRKGFS